MDEASSQVPGVAFDPIHTDPFVLALPRTHPTLIGVALRKPAVARELGLATRRGAALRAPARMFHDHLRAELKARR